MRRTDIGLVALCIIVLVSDRITKIIATRLLQTEPVLFSPYLGFLFHKNTGLIADVAAPRLAIIGITFVLIACILHWIILARRHQRTYRAYALVFILAGAIGNIWDRISYGFVIDWLLLFQRSVINLADIAIVFGLCWILLEEQRERKKSG